MGTDKEPNVPVILIDEKKKMKKISKVQNSRTL